jgi:hypothetical protein
MVSDRWGSSAIDLLHIAYAYVVRIFCTILFPGSPDSDFSDAAFFFKNKEKKRRIITLQCYVQETKNHYDQCDFR